MSTDTITGFAGAALPAGIDARDFALTDQSGRRTALADFRGQVTVLDPASEKAAFWQAPVMLLP